MGIKGKFYDIEYRGSGESESVVPGCYDYTVRSGSYSFAGTMLVFARDERTAYQLADAEIDHRYGASAEIVLRESADQEGADDWAEEVLEVNEEYHYNDFGL